MVPFKTSHLSVIVLQTLVALAWCAPAWAADMLIPPGQEVTLTGQINDFVDCQGTARIGGYSTVLANGLLVSAGGVVDGTGDYGVINGSVYVNEQRSGATGGSIAISTLHVGQQGQVGTFTQSDGSVKATLTLGEGLYSQGSYILQQGSLTGGLTVGQDGVGSFRQDSGNVNCTYSLTLGSQGGAYGRYEMFNGTISSGYMYIGLSGIGEFIQHDGAVTTKYADLRLGNNAGSFGSYRLMNGSISTSNENIGGPNSVGMFEQSGGTNTGTFISIGPGSRYTLSAGELRTSQGIDNQGLLDFANGTGSIIGGDNMIINLGHVANAKGTRFEIGQNSLLIVPPGLNVTTAFASYSNQGILHVAGTPLSIAAGQTVYGRGTIADHVDCQGQVYTDTLRGGVSVSGSGSVGAWSVVVSDNNSGVSDNGYLEASSLEINYDGSLPIFRQSGGIVSAGIVTINGGVYDLSGGQLEANGLDVQGTLQISPSADIRVATRVKVEQAGRIAAKPGSVIHLTNASFIEAGTNQCDDMLHLSLISDMTMFPMCGGYTYEASGYDYGAVLKGFKNNHALGRLQIGDVNTGVVWLENKIDMFYPALQVVYVENLKIGPGSSLDLAGLKLYCLTADIDPTAHVLEGSVTLVRALAGDCSLDGKVQFSDYLTVEQNFGKSNRSWSDGDFNGDGRVNFADYLLLEANFGKTISEPASLSLLALGGLSMLRRRR